MDAEIILNELNIEGTTFIDPIRPNIIIAGSGGGSVTDALPTIEVLPDFKNTIITDSTTSILPTVSVTDIEIN